MARVTTIPATKDKFTALPTASIAKRRVAAYARVSTDSDEQFTSYEAQIDYYTQYIRKRDDWVFVKVYTDEGISGCNTKRRDGFNEMVADALAEKIDLIVTKSVSRFARNTVDSLVTVRKLKEHHVEVFFEKENIFTFDSKIQCFYQTFDNGKCLLFFDLTEYVTMVQTDVTMSDGTTKKRTKPYYLADWQDSFGPPLQTIVNKVNQDFMAYYVVESADEPDTQQLALFESDTK